MILPAYNCSGEISESVKNLLSFFNQHSLRWEIIIVDDGSRDETSRAVAENEWIKIIRFPRNSGKGAAVRAGMLEARGKVRIFTDADLPYGTEPVSLAYYYIMDKGVHAVLGDRNLPGASYKKAGPLRNMISWTASLLFRTLITGGFYDTQCGFKAFRGEVAEALFQKTRINRFATDVEIVYLLLKYHLAIRRIPVRLRSDSPSTVRLFRDSLRAFYDSCKLPLYWHSGLYHCPALKEMAKKDTEKDHQKAKEYLDSPSQK
jgi:dolichyl-phosphate beta-glucosyltransferase